MDKENMDNNVHSYSYGPDYTQDVLAEDRTPLTMGEWLLTLLIGAVPCFGIVVYLVWAFGNSGNVNRKNFCRAFLILQLISLVLVILLMLCTVILGAVNYMIF